MNHLEYAKDDLNVVSSWEEKLAEIKIPRRFQKRMKRFSLKKYGRKHDLLRLHYLHHQKMRIGKYTYGFEQWFRTKPVVAEIGAFTSIANNVNVWSTLVLRSIA